MTSDAARTIARVLRASTHYDVLGIARMPFDPVALKRAYKAHALLIHPDKSDHPQAASAFKKLESAYRLLSDLTKRKQYDSTLPPPPRPSQSRPQPSAEVTQLRHALGRAHENVQREQQRAAQSEATVQRLHDRVRLLEHEVATLKQEKAASTKRWLERCENLQREMDARVERHRLAPHLRRDAPKQGPPASGPPPDGGEPTPSSAGAPPEADVLSPESTPGTAAPSSPSMGISIEASQGRAHDDGPRKKLRRDGASGFPSLEQLWAERAGATLEPVVAEPLVASSGQSRTADAAPPLSTAAAEAVAALQAQRETRAILVAAGAEHLELPQDVTVPSLVHLLATGGRPALLTALRRAGVRQLGDCQALANALGRAMRQGGGGVTSSRPATAASAPPPVEVGEAAAETAGYSWGGAASRYEYVGRTVSVPVVHSVAQMLSKLGLERYESIFEREGWDLDELGRTWRRQGRGGLDGALKAAGVRVLGHRVKLLHAVEAAEQCSGHADAAGSIP